MDPMYTLYLVLCLLHPMTETGLALGTVPASISFFYLQHLSPSVGPSAQWSEMQVQLSAEWACSYMLLPYAWAIHSDNVGHHICTSLGETFHKWHTSVQPESVPVLFVQLHMLLILQGWAELVHLCTGLSTSFCFYTTQVHLDIQLILW